jgi:hypothetical protein
MLLRNKDEVAEESDQRFSRERDSDGEPGGTPLLSTEKRELKRYTN